MIWTLRSCGGVIVVAADSGPSRASVWVVQPVRVEQSRAIPIGVEAAYRATLPMDLTRVFRRWYGPIPPIKEVRGQVGDWAAAGQTRTVALTGGGTMREELTNTDPPASFTYRLTDITGALGPLVDHIDGAWTFTSVGTGTEIGWRWTLHPRSSLLRPGVVLLGALWNGYARVALAELSEQLVRSP